jgi:hypothetical protein
VRTGFWWGNLRGRDHLEDLGLGGRKIVKHGSSRSGDGDITGMIWLRIRTGGEIL